RKIPHHARSDRFAFGSYFVERFCSELAGPFARRHPDRARALRVLFPDRHLHHSEHSAQHFAIDLSPVLKKHTASRKQLALARHVARLRVDRKSTRLNSSHQIISYAVFCLKKKI